MLSIITVVYNDKEGLLTTINSVRDQKKYFSNFEYIIIDGASTDGTLDTIFLNKDIISQYISEPDSGIYDAMNKGITLAKGNALLFLNAGDYFVGNVLGKYTAPPVYLPVKYTNIFGKYVSVKIKNVKKSIPTCHQGIVFENKKIFYDTNYIICADYKYFLQMYKNTHIKKMDSEGFIHFDSTGISSSSIEKRDNEMYSIRKEYFGSFVSHFFYLSDYIKRKIRLFITKEK